MLRFKLDLYSMHQSLLTLFSFNYVIAWFIDGWRIGLI